MAPSRLLTRLSSCPRAAALTQIRHASAAAVAAHSAPADPVPINSAAIQRYPPRQPPSFKPADLRKTQLHRQYTSLLRTTPLMLVFQHNNLRATEWAAIRRELDLALRKTSTRQAAEAGTPVPDDDVAGKIRLQVINPSIFSAALRVIEYFKPPQPQTEGVHAKEQHVVEPTHALSAKAYHAGVMRIKTKDRGWVTVPRRTQLDALLSGPIALLTFPDVTPAHLATALSILSPTTGAASAFPAPKRKDQPGLYEMPTQTGLQKLILLGARIEGRIMDQAGIQYVGGIKGGLDSLRAQLVFTLQSAGMGLTTALEGASKALWVAMESRRVDMENSAGAGESGESSAEAAAPQETKADA